MKRSNANLITLNVVFVVCLIVANVVTSKVLDTGIHIGGVPVLIPGAALTYALTFLCTDVIGEIWDGESVESVRSEKEWIGQRGSQFRVLKRQGRTIYLQMIGQLK